MESRSSYQFPFSRYPAVRIVLLLITGILLFYYYQPPLLILCLSFTLLLLLLFLTEWRNKQQVTVFLSHLATLLYILLLLIFGMLRAGYTSYSAKSDLQYLFEVMPWEEITLTGQVLRISKTYTGKTRWNMRVDVTNFQTFSSTKKYLARILVNGDKNEVTLGDHVTFTGTNIPITAKRNPYDFDYYHYLKGQGITTQIRMDSAWSVVPNRSKLEWIWWREKALELVRMNFDENTTPLANALLLGYKEDLDTASRRAFARAGLSHIMAVSGLHVGFIVAPFWALIPFIWSKKRGRLLGLLFLLLLLTAYAGITGFSSSVLRATVMAVFLTYARLFHKNNDSINLTAVAAFVLLCIDPSQLFQIGFQLSFAAVFIILLIFPVLQDMLPYSLRIRWYGKPIMVILITLVVQFGLYPLQVYYFGELSLIAPLANALFIPFLGVMLPLSLVALGVSAWLPSLGSILNAPPQYFLNVMRSFVLESTNWEGAWVPVHFHNNLLFLLWLILLFLLSSIRIPALRWKFLIGMLATLSIMTIIELGTLIRPAGLTITFFDVGQGDAALIQTPSGNNFLVDTGVWSPGNNSGRSVLLPHLEAEGIKELDAIILSHPHADHIGGVPDLIQNLPVHEIITSGFKYESSLYARYQELAQVFNIPVNAVQLGDTLSIDPALLILIMGPFPGMHSSDPNQHSIILYLKYGKTTFLFTGDAGVSQEGELVQTYGSFLNADLLKVGHHGSRSSSSSDFLAQVTPEYAIISLADHNFFGHPHVEALNRLHNTNANLLFTSLEGAIIFNSDGKTISRQSW